MSDLSFKPSPRWYEEDGKARAKGRRSRRSEKRFASALHGVTYSGSGNQPRARTNKNTVKGDLATHDFHIEHKGTTNKKSIGIKKAWLDKVEEGAYAVSKDPALAFTFESEDGFKQDDWIAMPLEVFQRLCRNAGLEVDDD